MIVADTQCTVHPYLQYLRDGKDAIHRDDCALCKQPLDAHPAVRMPCLDTFHWRCVVGAADPAAVRCPTCRVPLVQPGDSPVSRQIAALIESNGASVPREIRSSGIAKAAPAGTMAIEIGPAADFFKTIPSGRRDSASDSSTCLLLHAASAQPVAQPNARSSLPTWLRPPHIAPSNIPRVRAVVVVFLAFVLFACLLVLLLR